MLLPIDKYKISEEYEEALHIILDDYMYKPITEKSKTEIIDSITQTCKSISIYYSIILEPGEISIHEYSYHIDEPIVIEEDCIGRRTKYKFSDWLNMK